MVGEAVQRETLDANIAIWDNMINVLANKTGKTRSELADELPIVKAMKQGELQGLFQNELKSQVSVGDTYTYNGKEIEITGYDGNFVQYQSKDGKIKKGIIADTRFDRELAEGKLQPIQVSKQASQPIQTLPAQETIVDYGEK
jgi:hypothetical protein